MNEQPQTGAASPTYAPPPTPNSERPGSAYLILAINLVLMVAAIWWVIHRQKNPPSTPNASNDVAAVGRPSGTEDRPVVGTKGGPLLDAQHAKGADLGWGSLANPKGSTAAAKPVYDAETTEKIKETALEIHDIGVELEVLRAVRGAYPTSAVAGNDKNRGVEALLDALRKSGRDAGLKLSIGDTDGDGREEILDAWGRPLIYVSNDDYGAGQSWTGGDVVASKDPKGEFSARMRFQLWSAGPDGKTTDGDGDDVCSWEIGKEQ